MEIRTIPLLTLTGLALLASRAGIACPPDGRAGPARVPTLVRVDPDLVPAGEEAAIVLVDAATGRRIRTLPLRAACQGAWRVRARVVDARSRPAPGKARSVLLVLGTHPGAARTSDPVPGRLPEGRLVILEGEAQLRSPFAQGEIEP